jgi:hypothetical protein
VLVKDACLWCSAKGDDKNNLGQILEVLTPAQGYLMFFNNRGLTASFVVWSQTQTPFPSTNSFLLSVRSLFSSYCHSSKDTWSRSQLSKRSWVTVPARGQVGQIWEILHLVSEFLYRSNSTLWCCLVAVSLSFKHMLLDKRLSEHQTNKNCTWLSARYHAPECKILGNKEYHVLSMLWITESTWQSIAVQSGEREG